MIAVELRKQLPRARTWIALGIMALMPTVMTIGFGLGSPPHGERDRGLFELATQSGLNMPLAALSAMETFLLVVVVCLFGGETVAGEASWGTLRYLLLRPVRRARLLTAKIAVTALLVLTATFIITIIGLIDGIAAFGWHPFQTVGFGFSIPATTTLWRLLVTTVYVAWCMLSAVSFAFLISTLIDTPYGAVFAGVGFAVVSEILDAIPAFGSIRSGFPTHYWHSWESWFQVPASTSDMVTGVLVQIPYIAVFLGAAYYWFRRKDILS